MRRRGDRLTIFLRSTNARLRRARIHAYAHRCVRAYTRSQTRRARTHACAHRRVRAYTRTCTRARAHRSVRAHAASVRALLQACEQHEDALAHAHIHISTFTRSHTHRCATTRKPSRTHAPHQRTQEMLMCENIEVQSLNACGPEQGCNRASKLKGGGCSTARRQAHCKNCTS